ncbi:hypothetical protein B0H17DRAFT_1195062 [Mycena rosella]|uniref:Uncharacterized protein n=1 Tax=Mycena rosella TaxID=1033263 RepID=A0AAD7DZG0_MYCRO|nr:hypothetical protein B0H17DRAFT_1195062 [Mycena rosella]
MEDILSQFLSLASVVFIPFIPNNTMRYLALTLVSLFSGTYLVCHNSPDYLVTRLAESLQELDELLSTATNECTRDPRFVFEAGLKLTELKYVVSNLRTRAITAKCVAWKEYLHHLGRLALSIHEARREIANLRALVMLALECARQAKFEEDINHKTATLVGAFPRGEQMGA